MKIFIFIIFSLVLVSLITTGCEDNPTDNNYILILSSELDTLYIAGGSVSCQITAELTNNGKPVTDAQINFSSSIGSIDANAATNENGIAAAEFVFEGSGNGNVIIQANYNQTETELNLYLIDGYAFELNLYSDSDTLFLGSEQEICLITATLTEQNEPISNAEINFSANLGEITQTAFTNDQGIVQIYYGYSGSNTGTALIQAAYNGLVAELDIYIVIDPGLELNLTSDSYLIYLNSSINYCQISAQLLRDNEPVAGKIISFSCNTGSIFNSDTTDSEGIAQTTFWYDDDMPVIASITASFRALQAQVEINITNQQLYLLNINAQPDTIFLNSGNYGSIIRAELTNAEGEPQANQIINLQATQGFIPSGSMTNNQGIAEAQYVFSGEEETDVLISAQFQQVTDVCYIHVREPDVILTCWADPDTIYEDTSQNYCEIYAQLQTEYGAPLIGEQVNFSADIGSILGFDHTNALGIAVTTYWYDERPDITATITASYQELIANTNVTILTNQPQIVFLEADPLIIYADNDSLTFSTITTRVVYSNGSPAPGLIVDFETSLGNLSSDTQITDNNGYAVTHLHDSGISGVATVYVYCENDQSQIDIQILEPEPPRGKK